MRFFAKAYVAVLPGVALAAFIFALLFVPIFVIFVDPNSTNSVIGETLQMGCFGVLASMPVVIAAVLFWATLGNKPEPDVFSSIMINWTMIPIGYGAALLVGFSIYPDDFYLMLVFASAPLFGSLFGILYSRLILRPEKRFGESRGNITFTLRSMLVVTAWLSVILAIALANGFAFWVAITCVPASLLGWAISILFPRIQKPQNGQITM